MIMEVWTSRVIRGVNQFLWGIDSVHEGEPLVLIFRPEELSEELVAWHKQHFSYQHHDTIRSFTQRGLRPRGNHGKREDFAYYNRAHKFFGYDQFAKHRVQPNKLICMWNPAVDGDYVGEHNPCMVLVKFQSNGRELDLKVVFRKRELLSRMVGNLFMLGEWLKDEADMRKMKTGTITDFSMDTTFDSVKLKELRKTMR